MGGIWSMQVSSFEGPYDVSRARLLAPQQLYAGRLVRQRSGAWALMGFENGFPFAGRIGNPLPLVVDADGNLSLAGGAMP